MYMLYEGKKISCQKGKVLNLLTKSYDNAVCIGKNGDEESIIRQIDIIGQFYAHYLPIFRLHFSITAYTILLIWNFP